jgi:hypothetical protein
MNRNTKNIFKFPKRIGGISFSGLDIFPNTELNNWILVDAQIENNQKIRLIVKAIDTGAKTNAWIRAKKGTQPTLVETEQFLKQILIFKERPISEVKQVLETKIVE